MSISLLRDAGYLDVILKGITCAELNTKQIDVDNFYADNIYVNSVYYTGITGSQVTTDLLAIKDFETPYSSFITNEEGALSYDSSNVLKQTGNTYNTFVLSSGATCSQGGVNITGGVTCNNMSFTIFTNNANIIAGGEDSFIIYSDKVKSTSKILYSINSYGTEGTGVPYIYVTQVNEGNFKMYIKNLDTVNAMNTTLKIVIQILN